MNIIISFDYEMFFGRRLGTVEKCLLQPSETLMKFAQDYDVKFSFFVDTGYLLKLREYAPRYPRLAEDYKKIVDQLHTLAGHGHELQLHIHSHWENSRYDGTDWELDLQHYKLQSFAVPDIEEIVRSHKSLLEEISPGKTIAFRAGGWCVQPFDVLAPALRQNGITIDSSVFVGGFTTNYDFRNAPSKPHWTFSDNPVVEDPRGSFWEIPIATIRESPLFYWRLLAASLNTTSRKHSAPADGTPLRPRAQDILKWLVVGNNSVVSADGVKSGSMNRALAAYVSRYHDKGCFVTIGHPKSMTPYSADALKEFISRQSHDHVFSTYGSYLAEVKKHAVV